MAVSPESAEYTHTRTRRPERAVYLQVEVRKRGGVLVQQRLEVLGHEAHTEQTPVVMGLFPLHHLHTGAALARVCRRRPVEEPTVSTCSILSSS